MEEVPGGSLSALLRYIQPGTKYPKAKISITDLFSNFLLQIKKVYLPHNLPHHIGRNSLFFTRFRYMCHNCSMLLQIFMSSWLISFVIFPNNQISLRNSSNCCKKIIIICLHFCCIKKYFYKHETRALEFMPSTYTTGPSGGPWRTTRARSPTTPSRSWRGSSTSTTRRLCTGTSRWLLKIVFLIFFT